MPAHPKLPDDHWANIRSRWESDPRNGYSWMVADMALPVTGAAVRKKALRQGWRKKPFLGAFHPKSSDLRTCCVCCGDHELVDKTSVRRECIPQSEILYRLARALEIVEDCASALRETMPQRNHQ